MFWVICLLTKNDIRKLKDSGERQETKIPSFSNKDRCQGVMSEDLTSNLLHAHYHWEMTNLQCERAISIPNQPFKSHSAWFRPLAARLKAQLSWAPGSWWGWDTDYPSFLYWLSTLRQRVQHPPDGNPASSQEAPSLNGRNSPDRVEFPDSKMLGREEGQLHNPALYRFVLLSYRILSSALSIPFEITLSLSLLLSNNHSLLFLSLLSSSSSWLIISESWNLHMESHLYHEKAKLNKIFIRNMQLLQSVGFYLFQRGK